MTEFPVQDIQAFLAHHGLPTGPLTPISTQAVVNEVYFVGDGHVVRINRPTIETDDAYTESVAVPAVRAAGIKTPELLVFDDSRSILNTVVTVYERAPGLALGRLRVDQSELPSLYREIGAEVARIQRLVTTVDDPLGRLDPCELYDSRRLAHKAFDRGQIESVTFDWLIRWLDRVEPATQATRPLVFSHSDLHSFNTLVLESPLRLSCVIDWGDAGWADPSDDFTCVPLWAVAWMIEGYEAEGGTFDASMAGRIVWQVLGAMLDWEDRTADEPWSPLTNSLWANLVRFSRMDLDDRWRPWLPGVLP